MLANGTIKKSNVLSPLELGMALCKKKNRIPHCLLKPWNSGVWSITTVLTFLQAQMLRAMIRRCLPSLICWHTVFMAGGCENLPIIFVCHRAALFDLDAMCMFGSTAHTEEGDQTVQPVLWLTGNRQFEAVCIWYTANTYYYFLFVQNYDEQHVQIFLIIQLNAMQSTISWHLICRVKSEGKEGDGHVELQNLKLCEADWVTVDSGRLYQEYIYFTLQRCRALDV